MKRLLQEYFRFFRWIFLTIIILVIILIVGRSVRNLQNGNGERQNILAPAQRVYDYGDILTDEEEQNLEKLIAERQVQAHCDIVLVTLNESLKEYARNIEPDVPYNNFVRVYAEQFYKENQFGYDMPNGTGVLLVDNWFREEDGKIHTWLYADGRAYSVYQASVTDSTLDHVYEYVENDPYRAYKTFVNDVADEMDESGFSFLRNIPSWTPLLFGIFVAVVFFSINWRSRSGSRTTTATTYVTGGRAEFTDRRDVFIRKTVVEHRIETDNHSGGGSSSGGGGGGGGGHSR